MQVRPKPPDDLVKALLAIGLFSPTATSERASWSRTIGSEGNFVLVSFAQDEYLELSIYPMIANYAQHEGKRQVASVMFEMAARIAERSGGMVIQSANIAGCIDDGASMRTLAQYPGVPMRYEALCAGFRELFLGPSPNTGQEDVTLDQ